MFTVNNNIQASSKIIDFYATHLKEFGDSSQGVGWKDELAQKIRFEQLVRVISSNKDFSINDLGCGTGEFYKFLTANGYKNFKYLGYDILMDMLEVAIAKFDRDSSLQFNHINSTSDMVTADYTIASGLFNIKFDFTDSDWLGHIIDTLNTINLKSTFGFAFNLLTIYSDKGYMKPSLYYADPLFVFDYCKKTFSKNIALLHDYNQFDFTIIVKKS